MKSQVWPGRSKWRFQIGHFLPGTICKKKILAACSGQEMLNYGSLLYDICLSRKNKSLGKYTNVLSHPYMLSDYFII